MKVQIDLEATDLDNLTAFLDMMVDEISLGHTQGKIESSEYGVKGIYEVLGAEDDG